MAASMQSRFLNSNPWLMRKTRSRSFCDGLFAPTMTSNVAACCLKETMSLYDTMLRSADVVPRCANGGFDSKSF